MNRNLSLLFTLLCGNVLLAADPEPKDILASAAKTLADQPNYSWKTTVEVPNEPTGTIEGNVQKDGATVLALARGDQSFDAVLKANRGALKTEDGWKSLTEASAEGGGQPGATRFVARLLQNLKAPPAEVADLAGKLKDLKLTDGVCSGMFTEETAKDLLLYRTGTGAAGPRVSGAKGSAKFWLKDGALSKYEFKLQGTISVNGNDREVDRTHTTEIKSVGTTKVSVPDEAAKKL